MIAPDALREQDVALGDRADAAVDDLDLDFARRRAAMSASASASAGPPWSALMRMWSVRAPPAADCAMKSSSVTPPRVAATALRLAIETLATLRDFARRRRVLDDEELIAGHRHALEAEDLHRDRRAGRLDRLAALVEQRAHAAGVHAADEVVADLERAVLHEHRGDRTLARIELRFDDRSLRAPIRIRLEVEDLRLEQDLVEQRVDVRSLLRRDLGREHLCRRTPRARRRAAAAPASPCPGSPAAGRSC